MNYQQWNMIDVPSIFGPRYDRINIFYSNPDYYTQQKRLSTNKQDPVEWPVKTDDFFPYSDCPHCFWTGYFTSRAALKRFERVASSFLLAARQIDAMTPIDSSMNNATFEVFESPLFPLEDAVSIAQHHDAVSGTAKQHVADDYSLKLSYGLNEASKHVIHLLKRRMLAPDEAGQSQLPNLTYCPLLNETKCDVSVVCLISNILLCIAQHLYCQLTDLFVAFSLHSRMLRFQTTLLCIFLFIIPSHKIVPLLFGYLSLPIRYSEWNVLRKGPMLWFYDPFQRSITIPAILVFGMSWCLIQMFYRLWVLSHFGLLKNRLEPLWDF